MSTSVSDLPQPLSVQFYFVNLTSSCSLIPLYVQFPSRLPYFSSSLIDHFLPKIQIRLEEEKDSDSMYRASIRHSWFEVSPSYVEKIGVSLP